MAYLSSLRNVVTKSELDIFLQKPAQTSIESAHFVELRPISVFDSNSPIEFFMTESDEYFDLNHTCIRLRVKICNEDGTNLADESPVCPVNNFCNSLFSHVAMELNGKTVTSPNNSYAYRSYIECLLNYTNESKAGHLGSGLFVVDEPGKFDDVTSSGFQKRKSLCHKGMVELSSYLHLELTNCEKAILNGVSIRFIFYREKSSFSLMTTDEKNYRIDIQDASLMIRKLKINPSVMVAHERTLAQHNAVYPVTRIEIKKITLPKDTQSKSLNNIFIGKINFFNTFILCYFQCLFTLFSIILSSQTQAHYQNVYLLDLFRLTL